MTKKTDALATVAASQAPVSTAAAAEPKTVDHLYHAPADLGLAASGSNNHSFATKIVSDVLACMPSVSIRAHENYKDMTVEAAMEAMKAFEPKDAIEGMLAAQAVALHAASMECLRRSLLGQTPETASKLRKDGANLARAMCDMLASLDRKRGKGQQHIRVERVMVGEGGQAIVGNVAGGPARVGG